MMTKFGSFVRLSVTISTQEDYYVTEDIDTDCLILTHLPKFVSVLNVSENSIVKEWTLQQKHITCPVIGDKKSNRYVAVADEMVLRSWDRNDSKIGRVHQCTVTKEVYQLVSIGDATFILYKDGSFSTYQPEIQYFGKAFVKDDEHISQCEGYALSDAVYIVLVVEKTTVENVPSVRTCIYKFSNRQELLSCWELPISLPADASCVASCLQCSRNQLFLTVLMSSGDLCQLDITSRCPDQKNLTRLSCGLTSSQVSMVTLSDTQVAILGVHDESGTAGLGIWDTSFGILQAWTAVPDKNISKAKLHRHKNRLILLSDKGLYSCLFVAMTTTIGGALGSLKDKTAQTLNIHRSDMGDLDLLGEELLTQSGKQFENALDKFLKKVQKSAENKLLARTVVSRLVPHWVSKCGSDRTYRFPDRGLTQLLEYRLLSASDFDKLLPVLVQNNNVCLVYKCLMHVPDVSEGVICKCLQFYISCEDNRLEEAAEELGLLTHKPSQLESLPVSEARSVFLSQILCLPFNDVFLLERLKYIPFTQVMVLMNYLHCILTEAIKPPQISDIDDRKQPTLLQVIDWLNLLIDAHYTQFVLSQEPKAFVIELHQLVETKVEFFKELNALEAVLFQLKEKNTVPQRKSVGPYCIETLHIL